MKKKQPPEVKPEDIATAKHAGKRTSIEVATNQLRPAPWNPRPPITPESVADIAASIKSIGLIQPLIVMKDPDKPSFRGQDFYLLIAGHRRLAAWSAANMKGKIRCELIDCDIETAKRMTTIENLQRKDVDPIMEADLIEGLIQDGMTIEAIAAETGRGEKWVWRRKQLKNLWEGWADMARENPGMFSIDCLEKIARYDKELQKSVFEGNKPSVPYEGYPPIVWEDYKYDFRNLSRELKDAVFCTKECESCMRNSACQPMLFDDPKDNKGRTLGRCMDEACFKRKQEDHIAAEKVKLEKKYGTIREVKNSWDIPGCATLKKTKDNTVPYIVKSMCGLTNTGIMWGTQPKSGDGNQITEEDEKAAKKAKRERRKAQNELGRFFTDDDCEATQSGKDAVSTFVFGSKDIPDEIKSDALLRIFLLTVSFDMGDFDESIGTGEVATEILSDIKSAGKFKFTKEQYDDWLKSFCFTMMDRAGSCCDDYVSRIMELFGEYAKAALPPGTLDALDEKDPEEPEGDGDEG